MQQVHEGQCGLCAHFGENQPQEQPRLYQIRVSGQAPEDLVEPQDGLGRLVAHRGFLVEGDGRRAPAPPQRSPAPGGVDEDAPHGLGGDGQEVGAVLPRDALDADETEIGFVDEAGGLDRVGRAFAAEARPREAAKLLVDLREQRVEGLPTAPARRDQEIRDVRALPHEAHSIPTPAAGSQGRRQGTRTRAGGPGPFSMRVSSSSLRLDP